MVFTSTTSATTLGPATSKLLLSFSISHCHTLCLVLDTQHQGQLQLHVIWVELDTTSKYSHFNSTILSIASLSDRQLPWSIPFIVKWAPDADSLLSCWLVSGICFITLYSLECLQGLLMPLMCLFSVISHLETHIYESVYRKIATGTYARSSQQGVGTTQKSINWPWKYRKTCHLHNQGNCQW